MKIRKSLLLVFLISVILNAGCNKHEERTTKKMEELMDQAENYYNDNNISKALLTYEKAYKLKDSIQLKEKINNIKNEIQNAKLTNAFLTSLFTIQIEKLRHDQAVTVSELDIAMKDIKKLIDDFESLDVSQESDINSFIKTIQNDDISHLGYQMLKKHVNDYVYINRGTTDVLPEFDSNSIVYTASSITSYRETIYDCINEILNNQLPTKYNNALDNKVKL